MRGRRPLVVRQSLIVALVLLFVGSGAATALPVQVEAPVVPSTNDTAPTPDATAEPAPLADLLGDVPFESLADHARRLAAQTGPSDLPAPDALAGYARLDETSARIAWAAWVEASAWAATRGSDPFGPSGAASTSESTVARSLPLAQASARGLKGIWSVDEHGEPRAMHPAGDDGAHFLVTSAGVLRFPSATDAPDWMVKPGGQIGRAETTDANGDGVLDIVLGLYSWWVTDDPSIVVVDGSNGAILWTGLPGLDSLYEWTLSDIDDDGTADLLGLDASGRMVAYTLGGTAHYQVDVPQVQDLPQYGFLVFYLAMAHRANMGHLFADVDGDGVQDFAIASSLSTTFGLLISSVRSEAPTLTAYSGRDAALLWQVPTGAVRPTGGYTFPISAGDFDGDGADDLLVVELEVRALPGFRQMESHYKVFSGTLGLPLARDVGVATYVCPESCVGDMYGESYQPIALRDLDGDGQAEIVGVIATYLPFTLAVVGRGAPAVPGGPLTELYRHELKMDGEYDWADGPLTFRDVDGDDSDELVVFLFSEVTGDHGRLEDIAIHRFFVDDEAATGGRLDGLLGFYDVLPDGTALGWDVRTDRWSTVDAQGLRTTDGFRLVLSTRPLAIVDRDGDKVPDLLLAKTIGYLWIDGRTGRLLEDVERPITSYISGVYEEKGRTVLLERDWRGDEYRLIDALTAGELWSVSAELAGDDGWMNRLADVSGDGRLDLVFETWGSFRVSRSDIPFASPTGYEEPERRFWVVDAVTQETVFERTLQSGSVWVADAIPARSGDEVLVRTRDGEARMLELHVPGEEGPRWAYNLGDGRFRAAEEGYILVSVEQESEVFEVLVGASGERAGAYPLPANGHTTQTFFTRVNGDRFPELVTSFVIDDGDGAQEMVIHDWANEQGIARFALEKGAPETVYFPEWDEEYVFESESFVTEMVGDWDGDGLVDFAYYEADRAVVRSTGTGALLAIAPGNGAFIRAHDMNAAGVDEVFMLTEEGRLRLFSYAPRVGGLEAEPAERIRTIHAVNESETHGAAEEFFQAVDEEGLPAPGFGLAVAFLAFVVFVVRRRNGE